MPQGRKVLWVLGAGASAGAGAFAQIQHGGRIPIPTQADFWPTVLRFCNSRKRRKLLDSFLFRYFTSYGRVPARAKPLKRAELLRAVDVEEAFTFLSERIQSPSTSTAMRTYLKKVWPVLVGQVGVAFQRFEANASTIEIYRTLRKNAIRGRDAVVSFNYDTIFEDSLPGYFEWHYNEVGGGHGLPILKPHGSVNWAADPITKEVVIQDSPAKPVIVAPTHLKFVLNGRRLKDGGDSGQVDDDAEPEDGAATQEEEQLVGYLTQSRQISNIWAEMERQMSKAKAMVFIGYSFPVGDLYFSSVLRSVLAARDSAPHIVLVNPDSVAIAKRLTSRFALKHIDKHFDMKSFVRLGRDAIVA